jgi:K+ transporter
VCIHTLYIERLMLKISTVKIGSSVILLTSVIYIDEILLSGNIVKWTRGGNRKLDKDED